MKYSWLTKSRYANLLHKPTIAIINVEKSPGYVKDSSNKYASLHTTSIPNKLNEPVLLDYTQLDINEKDYQKPIVELEREYKKHIDDYVSQCLKNINGLLLLGDNNDVPPELFNQHKHPETKVASTPKRTLFVRSLMRQATLKKIPMLNICGSLQQFMVLEGASLHQHLPDVVASPLLERIDHRQPHLKHDLVHDIQVRPLNEQAAGIFYGIFAPQCRPPYRTFIIRVNSTHHQAINPYTLSNKTWVAGLAEDGTVEAVESVENEPWVGVQFHPEIVKRLDHNGKRTLVDRDFKHNKETGEDFYQNRKLPADPEYYIHQRILEVLVVMAHAHNAHDAVMGELEKNSFAARESSKQHQNLSFSQQILRTIANNGTQKVNSNHFKLSSKL